MRNHHIAVLGCGYTGKPLVRKLCERGYAVTATSRDPGRLSKLAALGARPLLWEAPQRLPSDLTGAIVLYPPRGVDPVQAAAALEGLDRIVYCSSTSVYGPRDGEWVEDDTPVRPHSPWAHARVAAEAAHRAHGAMVVRPAGIYGPDRNIVHRLVAGRLRVTGDPQRPVNLIHVDDLVSILIAAFERGRAGETYLAVSGRPVASAHLATLAHAVSGYPLPAPSPMPDNPNLRMFYEETKRCWPTRYAELQVTLRWPDVGEALFANAH